jgi:hypothetical protein
LHGTDRPTCDTTHTKLFQNFFFRAPLTITQKVGNDSPLFDHRSLVIHFHTQSLSEKRLALLCSALFCLNPCHGTQSRCACGSFIALGKFFLSWVVVWFLAPNKTNPAFMNPVPHIVINTL